MTKAITRFAIIGVAALVALSTGAVAKEMRLHGSATVAKTVIGPNLAGLQGDTGLEFKIVANGSGNGLKDLAAGRADMAMISAPLQVEADIANGKAPGSLDVAGMEAHPIGSSKIFFVTHPSNPVKTLTDVQVIDILSGQVKNWSEVGGKDAPIQLFIEKTGQGTRATIEHLLMGGISMSRKARQVPALSQVTKIISQSPNGFGYGNASSIDSKVSTVGGVDVDQPLALVTRGAPSGDMRKLISEAVKLGG